MLFHGKCSVYYSADIGNWFGYYCFVRNETDAPYSSWLIGVLYICSKYDIGENSQVLRGLYLI